MSARPPLRDRGARKLAMLALGLVLGALGANVGEHMTTQRKQGGGDGGG